MRFSINISKILTVRIVPKSANNNLKKIHFPGNL